MSAMFTVTPARCVSKSQFTPGAAQLKAQPARVQSRCAKVAPKRALKVQSMHRLGDTSGMSAEQIEFLKRKHGIVDSDPGNAPGALNTHGAGDTREKPQQAAYVPPPAPAAPAADTSGFSPDQLAFLARKKAGDTEIAGAMNTHGAGDTRAQAAPAPAPAYVPPPAPVAAADPSGFSPDQLAFLARKKAGDTEIAGAMNTHGAGDTRAQAAPAPAPAYVPPPAPVAAADPSGFSPDQLAFLARKKAGDTEIAGAMNTHGAGDTRGQSAPAPAYVPPPAPAAAADPSGFSPEQLEFLARKKAGTC